MRLDIKRESAANTLTNRLLNDMDHNTIIKGLQEIRDISWRLAMKYRFDPAVGGVHEEYLTLLNRLIKEVIP